MNEVICDRANSRPHLECHGCSHSEPHSESATCVTYMCHGLKVSCVPISQVKPEIQDTPGAMPLEELLELHKSTTDRCREVMKAKNHDYTCAGGVFDNFKASEMIGVHPVLGILMRTMDKFKRIQTFITKGKLAVEGEGVLDAIDDSINYLILVKGIIIEEQRMKK